MDSSKILKYSIFIEHGHLQYSGTAWHLHRQGNNGYHFYVTSSDHPSPISGSILFYYELSMEAGKGKRELCAGLEEASLQEEGQKDSAQQEVSPESSDECGSYTMRAEPIPNDDFGVTKWLNYFCFSRYLGIQVAYAFGIMRTYWN